MRVWSTYNCHNNVPRLNVLLMCNYQMVLRCVLITTVIFGFTRLQHLNHHTSGVRHAGLTFTLMRVMTAFMEMVQVISVSWTWLVDLFTAGPALSILSIED